MLKNYILTSIRRFYKQKTFSLINIAGLSLSLSVCLLVWIYSNNQYSFDQFHPKKGQIYRITSTIRFGENQHKTGASSVIMGDEFHRQLPEIEQFTRIRRSHYLIQHGKETINAAITFVDRGFATMFDFPVLFGDLNQVLSSDKKIAITEKEAYRIFNSTQVIGKTIEVKLGEDFEIFTIEAVLKDPPNNSSIQFERIIAFDTYKKLLSENRKTQWHDLFLSTFIQLKEGSNIGELDDKMNQIIDSNSEPEDQGSFILKAQNLSAIYMGENFGSSSGVDSNGDQSLINTLVIIAVFILFIACTNFINLSIGMAFPRAKEICMRKVIGANKPQIILQFMGEALMITSISMVLSLLFADLALPFFNKITNNHMNLWDNINSTVYLGAAGILLLTTLFSGSYPAFKISNFNIIKGLKGRIKLGQKNAVAKTLVIAQFSIAIVMVCGIYIVNSQLDYIARVDLGYNPNNIIKVSTFRTNGESFTQHVKNTLGSNSAVKGITMNSGMGDRTDLDWENKKLIVNHSKIDANYISTMGLTLLEGRNFSEIFPADSLNSILVNETFVKLLGLENPVGTKVPFNYYPDMDRPTIIGVVKDFHFSSLKAPIAPLVMYIHPQDRTYNLFVKTDQVNFKSITEKIEKEWKDQVAYYPFEYESMDDSIEASYENEENERTLINYAALFSLFVACIGLFGLSNLHIQQRSKEVGIRKVMGANIFKLIFGLSKDFILLILIAIVISLPIAWYVGNLWLEHFAYKTALNFGFMMAFGFLSVVIAAFTISFHVIKTANINPVNVLKDE